MSRVLVAIIGSVGPSIALRVAVIRGTPEGHVPIVPMTGSAVGGNDRCLAAGMDDYTTKPVTAAELEAVLGEAVPAETGTIRT